MLHQALGNMYINQDPPDLEKSVQSYLNANALSPTNPEPLQLIAQAYSRFGEYGKASQYAADAVSLAESNAGLHGDLGVYYYKNGEYDKAIEELNLAVRGGQAADGTAVRGIPLRLALASSASTTPWDWPWPRAISAARRRPSSTRCSAAYPTTRSPWPTPPRAWSSAA
jgi:tetratricopeptide (TPR) repeat protein